MARVGVRELPRAAWVGVGLALATAAMSTVLVLAPYVLTGSTWTLRHIMWTPIIPVIVFGSAARSWFERRYGTRGEIERELEPTVSARLALLLVLLLGWVACAALIVAVGTH